MIAQCEKCGSHKWNKIVEGSEIICPECNHRWSFKKLPLFILTGCSGVGKTTTAKALMQKTENTVVLDADFFYNLMPHETSSDYLAQIEKLQDLSKNIMQSGRAVVWAKAGNIDMLKNTYNCRFFSAVYCLALVCKEETLRERMSKGRGITDEQWIKSSVDYNEYFKTHRYINGISFDVCDIEGMTPDEAAVQVQGWIDRKLTKGM